MVNYTERLRDAFLSADREAVARSEAKATSEQPVPLPNDELKMTAPYSFRRYMILIITIFI